MSGNKVNIKMNFNTYYKEFCVNVLYCRANEFRNLIEYDRRILILKVEEVCRSSILMYKIRCPKELKEDIKEKAFLSFVRSDKFQKYYRDLPDGYEIPKFVRNNRVGK